MKVLFSLRNLWYVKHYELVLRELARRGHAVSVITEPLERNDRSWVTAAESVARDWPAVRFEQLDKRAQDVWFDLATSLRWGSDYIRFLDPLYDRAPKLRERAEAEAPRPIKTLAVWASRFAAAGLVRRLLDLSERAVPLNQELQRRVAEEAPDVVILSPLIALGTLQIDVLRAACRLGIPTILAVGSWDHLSSKGLVREIPDQVFVWNEVQRREAIELQGVPADRIVVTGAQAFDHWFEWRARPREEFLSEVGLPAHRPYVMYACSCLIDGSPIEAEFVYEWVKGFRSSAALSDASILIRPHPKRDAEFDQVDLSEFPDVAVWPRGVVGPVIESSKADYFDSLYHSEAVVGLNTSAFIEAGIVGRPVLAPLLPEFWENQEGTLHFRHLLDTAGGLLQTSRSLAEHYGQLIRVLDAEQDPDASRFLDAFVHSPERSRRATDVFVDAAERAANSRPRRRPPSAVPVLLRPALYPLARFVAATSSRAEREVRQRRREAKARTRQAEQRQRREARLAYEAAHRHEREAERRAKAEAKDEKVRLKREAQEERARRQLEAEEERKRAREEHLRRKRAAREEHERQHQAAKRTAKAQASAQARLEREQQRRRGNGAA